jgi:hypothetical protein
LNLGELMSLSFRCDMQAVVSDRKLQKDVVTVAIGGRRAREGRVRLPCCHLGAHNDSAAWVCNGSADVPRARTLRTMFMSLSSLLEDFAQQTE